MPVVPATQETEVGCSLEPQGLRLQWAVVVPLFYSLGDKAWARLKKFLKIGQWDRAWWFTPVIPALWETKAGGSQGQEFETILANMVKPHLYPCNPSYSGSWEARESLAPGRQKLHWPEITPLHCSLGDRMKLHLKNKNNKKNFT